MTPVCDFSFINIFEVLDQRQNLKNLLAIAELRGS